MCGMVSIPEAVADYCRMMQGVDRHNQFSGAYTFDHKCVKWWQPLFLDMLNRCVVNAWVLHGIECDAKNCVHRLTQRSFVERLSDHLCGAFTTRKRSRRAKLYAHGMVSSQPHVVTRNE